MVRVFQTALNLCPQNYDENGNKNVLAEIRQNNNASELKL